jgi:hypothetical protein
MGAQSQSYGGGGGQQVFNDNNIETVTVNAPQQHQDNSQTFQQAGSAVPEYVSYTVYLLPRQWCPLPGTHSYPEYPEDRMPKQKTYQQQQQQQQQTTGQGQYYSNYQGYGESHYGNYQQQQQQQHQQQYQQQQFMNPGFNNSLNSKKRRSNFSDSEYPEVRMPKQKKVKQQQTTGQGQYNGYHQGYGESQYVNYQQPQQQEQHQQQQEQQQEEQQQQFTILGFNSPLNSKKPRTIFTDSQCSQMRAVFRDMQYLSRPIKSKLAESLDISEDTVAVGLIKEDVFFGCRS